MWGKRKTKVSQVRNDPPALPSERSQHLLSVRAAVILLVAMLAGVTAGALTWLAFGEAWSAVLAGAASFIGAIDRLDTWIEP